jgi:transcriptional regulator with XRE-family HTH domain
MAEGSIDLDLLAKHLEARMEEKKLSIRAAAAEIGCSHATLGRLLQGSKAGSVPDSDNLIRAASWVGKSLDDLGPGARPKSTTMADVEVHLRALPGLRGDDAEAITAMVKAAYGAAKKRPPKR